MYLLSWYGMLWPRRDISYVLVCMINHVWYIWCSIRGWFSRANDATSSVRHAPGMPFSRPRGRRLQWKLKSPRRLLVTRCVDASLTGICDISDIKWYIYIYYGMSIIFNDGQPIWVLGWFSRVNHVSSELVWHAVTPEGYFICIGLHG